jgi:hypothetical protein
MYQDLCDDYSFNSNLEMGYHYWLENFFDKDKGMALYYDRNKQPSLVDLHCVAQSMATLFKLGKMGEEKELANKLIKWAIDNMQSKKGYFCFQKKGLLKSRIEYMRWPNAWMFYGMSYWLNYNYK